MLLQGETGTGKGFVARLIHASGPRAQSPLVEVNCAAIPESLLEAELFGYEAGAFTDARRPKPGLFETASGGSLLLDEIEALPMALQAKLLNVIEEKRVRRLGAVAVRQIDVKLMAATNADLDECIREGRFRADLYHRLAVVILQLPPLRERGRDSLLLAQHFLRQYAAAHGVSPKHLHAEAETWLLRYSWPGNVRELSNLMERVTLLHAEPIIDVSTLERLCRPPAFALAPPRPMAALDGSEPAEESTRIRQALLRTGGNVVRAARLLGMSRSALRYRMQRYGILPQRWDALTLPQVSPKPPTLAWPGAVRDQAAADASPEPADDWEHKTIAVLAVALTFPPDRRQRPVRSDPWTEMARWEWLLTEKVQGFGGVIIQRSPSLLLAGFGVPQALEQMLHRTVQAAIAIRHLAVETWPRAERESCPSVRLAVHGGAALVEIAASDATARVLAVGDTVMMPVHLLGHTHAGEVLVIPQVARRVEDLYELQMRHVPLALDHADGVVAYTIGRRRSHPATPTPRAGHPLSRFVGRQRELAALQALLEQVEAGHGQVVGIVGEPGIGKSRFLDEFRQSPQARRCTSLAGRCFAYGSATPYLPVVDLARQHLNVSEADDLQTLTAKVHRRLRAMGTPRETWAPYLLHLLGAPPATDQLAMLSPQALRARTFETLLQTVAELSEEALQRSLRQLQEAELLHEVRLFPEHTYTFKHVLTQEVAEQSLPTSRRQRIQLHIAQVLVGRFPEIVDSQPERVAHHYTEAGCYEQAVAYWQRAGRRAYERSANMEAMRHVGTGLEVLTKLPKTPQRMAQELLLQTTLGPVLMAAKGYAAPEVERTYTRARQLCQELGDERQLFPVLVGLWNFCFVRGQCLMAQTVGEQLLRLAQGHDDRRRLLRAHAALGEILFHIGQLEPARAHLEQGIALYDPQQHRSHAAQVPTVACLAYAAWTLWHLGYPDQALQHSYTSHRLAKELSHPVSLAIALHFVGTAHQFRSEAPAAQAWAEAALAIGREQGFPFWEASATILRGWALTTQGQSAEGIAHIQQGLAAFRATGAEVQLPSWLALLADAYRHSGEGDKGLRAVDEALAVLNKTGERYYEAELYRLRGELLLQSGSIQNRHGAAEHFSQALELARRWQARAWELRTAMSLSRLWQSQGNIAEARMLLAEVYGGFTEGFATADLQAAKALLEGLS